MSATIEALNPYPSFRSGQLATIEALLEKVRDGHQVIELNSPTGTGKSLMLTVLCRALINEHGWKATYTSPQRSLVHQLADDKRLGIVSLLGKANYYCPKVDSHQAGDCPVPSKYRRKTCPNCAYQAQKNMFLSAPLGAATLDKILVDQSIPTANILIIDESQGLEEKLLNQSEIGIPDSVDLNNLVESVGNWVKHIKMEILKIQTTQEKHFDDDGNLADFVATVETTKLAKKLVAYERILVKAEGVFKMASDAPDSFIITKDRNFRMMSGRQQFDFMKMGIDVLILASGTPNSQLLTSDYGQVLAPHPIEVGRRMVYFDPCGKMNMADRNATMEKMAVRIAELHKAGKGSTIVHCHSYPIADRLGSYIYDEGVRCKWVMKDDREGSIKEWQETDNTILMAVACEEGLDLAGPKYPLNIVAKVPFGFRGDEWMIAREAQDKPLDNALHFEDVRVAVAIQQAAGRTTRSPEDFSETYILDSSFEQFYRRNHNLFQDWFKAALRRRTET
jgi:hypothetical protein